jgi:hypothetical protein
MRQAGVGLLRVLWHDMRTRVAGAVQVLDSLMGISCTDWTPSRMKFIPYRRHPLMRFGRACTIFCTRGNSSNGVGGGLQPLNWNTPLSFILFQILTLSLYISPSSIFSPWGCLSRLCCRQKSGLRWVSVGGRGGGHFVWFECKCLMVWFHV